MSGSPMEGIVKRLRALTQYLSQECGGGPKPFKHSMVINFQKGGTLPLCLVLMTFFKNFSPTAWMYTALHGSYGLLWVMKDRAFPDASWEKKITIMGAINSFLMVLGPYWLIAYWTIANRVEATPFRLFLAAFTYALGVGVMLASDFQKNTTLYYRKGLIQSGMFKYIRNPNYLGEIAVYGSFALLSQDWRSWVILGYIWTLVFIPNMLAKDISLSRHDGFAAYKARSGLLFPPLGAVLRFITGESEEEEKTR